MQSSRGNIIQPVKGNMFGIPPDISKEEAKRIYQREKEKEKLENKIKSKYLRSSRNDPSFEVMATGEISKMVDRGSMSEADIRQLDTAFQSFRDTRQASEQRQRTAPERPRTGTRLEDLEQIPSDALHQESIEQDRMRTHSQGGQRNRIGRSSSNPTYEWSTLLKLQAEQELKQTCLQRERERQQQITNRLELERQIQEKRERMENEKAAEVSYDTRVCQDADTWKSEIVSESLERKKKSQEYSDYLRKQADANRKKIAEVRAKSKEEEVYDILTMYEEIEMSRNLEKQKRSDHISTIRRDMEDSIQQRQIRLMTEVNELKKAKDENLDIAAQMTLINDARRTQHDRAVKSRERRQEQVAKQVSGQYLKIQEEEERFKREQQKQLDILREKEEKLRLKSQEEKLAIQQALIHQMEEKKRRKEHEAEVLRQEAIASKERTRATYKQDSLVRDSAQERGRIQGEQLRTQLQQKIQQSRAQDQMSASERAMNVSVFNRLTLNS